MVQQMTRKLALIIYIPYTEYILCKDSLVMEMEGILFIMLSENSVMSLV